jgi:UDP-2,3-diacylglucosamine hydrolase
MKEGRLGLIAGNGPLPGQVLLEASRRGIEVTVAAIKEEAETDLEMRAADCRPPAAFHWMGVGQLGRLLKVFRSARVERALMVGQVRHVRIFAPGSRSPLRQLQHLPDLRMVRLLASLDRRNTASLIEAVIRTLEAEGIHFLNSTAFLRDLLADSGVMTRRSPSRDEEKDMRFGFPIAREIARLDLGQTIVVKDQAVVAVEAMEGTDETIRRAARLVKGERLTVVKVSRPGQDMRFDVPVVGPRSLDVFGECAVSALAVDAGRTLLIDKPDFLRRADGMGIAVVGLETCES